jgi:zinc transporter, ZIP family
VPDREPLAVALGLTLLAGLATLIGGLIGVSAGPTNRRFLAVSLGLSGGMMIYISFVELMPAARSDFEAAGSSVPDLAVTLAFFAGMLAIAAIDFVIPEPSNPHMGTDETAESVEKLRLRRMGILAGLGIAIHNFPEGIATFLSAFRDLRFGLPVAVAVALHNIPEGVAVAVPVYQADGSRRKALLYCAVSGLAEPLGALLALAAIRVFGDPWVMALVTAGVAGVMVFISLDTLIPNAKRYEEGHDAVYGLMVGMGIMALTLLAL